jgi:protein TonB
LFHIVSPTVLITEEIAMHFAHSQHAAGSKTAKLALVVAFHVVLGLALVKTMNVRLLSMPPAPAPVTLIPPADPPVTSLPPTAMPVPQLPAPRVYVPLPAVPVSAPAPQNTVTTTTVATDTPATPPHAPAEVHALPNPGVAAPAGVRTAAMLDGCVKPAYPPQAARNGDSGTVTLALLVGVDGRVTGSRVEHSSGFRDLDRAALAALSLCTFKPAMQGDVAQAGWTLIAYQWTLQ